MVAIVGVLVGALLAYWFSGTQLREERKRRRQALATAILYELRVLDHNLRLLYNDREAGLSLGQVPMHLLAEFGPDMLLFKSTTIHQLLALRGLAQDVQILRENCRNSKPAEVTQARHNRIRAKE